MRNSLAALVVLLAGIANAASIEQPLKNPAQEQAARAIFHELRCVVCEGQSVADSDAVLAAQMRAHVRRLLAEGKNSRQVLEEFRSSYGDEILLTPPLSASTVLLWLAPLVLLGIGAFIVRNATRPKD